MNFIYVAIGGALGCLLRYTVGLIIPKVALFPWPTLVVNIIGCFLIGIFSGLFIKYNTLPSSLKILLIPGFCGGFTTFSTFANENLSLLQNGKIDMFALYTLTSFALGIFACASGFYLMK